MVLIMYCYESRTNLICSVDEKLAMISNFCKQESQKNASLSRERFNERQLL